MTKSPRHDETGRISGAADPGSWPERVVRGFCRLLVALGLPVLALVGCGGTGDGVGSDASTPTVTAAQAIALHSDSIMAIPGVTGLYEGRSQSGETVIRIMLARRSAETERKLPRKLEGYRVEIEESGPIQPMAK